MKKFLGLSALTLALVGCGTVPSVIVDYMYYVNPENNAVTRLYNIPCELPFGKEIPDSKKVTGELPAGLHGPVAVLLEGCWVVNEDTIAVVMEDGSVHVGINPNIFKAGPVPALKPIQKGVGI